MKRVFLGAAALATVTGSAAAGPGAEVDKITVTATRLPESVSEVPASIDVIDGAEARRRGAFDLRGALAPASGVEVIPGGDLGPAGSTVALQGLAEMDAYLLVVDGVPYGGAFNPATALFDPIDIDRVEVVRGAAPVSYGATSFVGVIHVLHAPPGEQKTRFTAQGGAPGFGRVAGATSLPAMGGIAHSVLASWETRDFTQNRGHFDRLHGLYRLATHAGPGRLSLDIEAVTLDQTPYSPHPREGGVMSTRFPLDANVNPRDARQDQDRLQANLAYAVTLGDVDWTTTVSAARTSGRTVRGFLREDFEIDGVTVNADGYRQKVRMDEIYLDTHLSGVAGMVEWLAGADLLRGRGRQHSANFEYAVLPNGANAPDSRGLTIDESTALHDARDFAGFYGQLIVRPLPVLTVIGGARLNYTVETRSGGEAPGTDEPKLEDEERLARVRPSGSIGVSYFVLKRESIALSLYGDYRNTYKPAAIDFGPESEAEILKPETADGWEIGLKGRARGGRITFDAGYFDTNFRNLVIAENVDGLPSLANAGSERFRGVEAEAAWRPTDDVMVSASYAWHLAEFTDFARLRPDGSLQQLAGNRLELSPRNVASLVALYAPASGLQAAVTARYVGERFINKTNTALAGDYISLDVRLGWRWGHYALFIEAENLTDRRDPVAESEIGDAQFYRLPGRRVFATLQADFD